MLQPQASPVATDETDVLILGASICGLMTAGYLKRNFPDLEVIVVGPRPQHEKRPIVGESLLEPATYFLHGIGLGDYLNREHAIKQGLSFYYKLSPADPRDRRYTVHSPEQLHRLSRQLHRPRFDEDLRDHVAKLGVHFVEGLARDVHLGGEGRRHRVTVARGEQQQSFDCRWLVDATGRNRWLGRKVTAYERPRERQRSVFWFRLANFQPFSERIDMSMRRGLKYDLWDTTHHFMGHGYFIWGIPLQSPEHDSMISLGLTYRPDLFPHPMKSLGDFLDFVDGEHPALAEMVRSGEVLDTQTYGNFLYWAEQIYSPDGWFLVGDAARAVDPLYSSGLSMTAIQVEQIGEIIARQRDEGISPEQIESLQKLWKSLAHQRQEDITTLYECMDDPFQACMRRYWNNISWFNVLLPLWWNGLFQDVEAAPVLHWLFERGKPMGANASQLFAKVARRLGKELTQQDYDRAVDFDWLLNPQWDCPREEVPYHFSQVFRKRAALRWKLLRMTGYRDLPSQLVPLGVELLMHRLLPRLLRGRAPHAFGPGRPGKTAQHLIPSLSRSQEEGSGGGGPAVDGQQSQRAKS